MACLHSALSIVAVYWQGIYQYTTYRCGICGAQWDVCTGVDATRANTY